MSEQPEYGVRSENPKLTPAILTELRAALLQRQADLQRQIADLRQNLSVPVDLLDSIEIDAPGDEGDASVDLQDREDSDQLLLELHAQLAEVEHALAKLETGTYGICEPCGRPIPLARLRVLPEARYDVEYEEDVEAGRAPR
jgi:RNA polymerase-binding transcription factor